MADFLALCLGLSAMIRGAAAENNGIVVKDYKEEDVPMLLKDFFEKPSCQ